MSYELGNLANRDYILENTTPDEQADFISNQIKSPFDSGDVNYFTKLTAMVNADRLDEICIELFGDIEDRYPNIEFDFSSYDSHLGDLFLSVYKFLVKNIQKVFYVFLREYIFSGKNRKLLVAEYMNMKMPNYPKDQYGKKEFYILMNKLNPILKDIADDNLLLDDMIKYLERAESTPKYVQNVKEFLEKGIICDHGVMDDLFKLFFKSDISDSIVCKLQSDITDNIINPYLESEGLLEYKITPVVPEPSLTEQDEDEEDTE